jgi:hypothetical protein
MPRSIRATDLQPGDRRLLHDLAVLRLALDEQRRPARRRVERQLGTALARRVYDQLAEQRARAA